MKETVKYFLNRLALWSIGGSSAAPRGNKARDKALIVRADNLGDLIAFLPALEKLCRFWADKEVTLVVSEAAAELAEGLIARGFPLARVVVVRRSAFNSDFSYKRKFLAAMRQEGYAIAAAPAYSRESIADTVVAASAAPARFGWQREAAVPLGPAGPRYDRAYTQLFEQAAPATNEMERNNFFARELGCRTDGHFELAALLGGADKAAAGQLMRERGLERNKFAVLAPGAGKAYRIWPLDRFAAVARHLAARGYAVAVIGRKDEKRLAAEIFKHCPSALDLCGELPLYALAALIAEAAVCVASESGLLQLAAALKVPSLCLMGGGHFKRFFPYDNSASRQAIAYDPRMKCRGDSWACARSLPDGVPAPCIAGIAVESVVEKVDSLLA